MKAIDKLFAHLAERSAEIVGSGMVFIISIAIVMVCMIAAIFFGHQEMWMIMNTMCSVITFLIVILIQNAQNRDTISIHLKINELIRAHKTAKNKLIDLDKLSNDELAELDKYYKKLSENDDQE